MKRFSAIVLLPVAFLFFGCASSGIDQRLSALEQSLKKRYQEIEKINRTLDEIKKEQAGIRAMAAENARRISQLEGLGATKRPEEKRIEGSITFVKGATAFISVGKNNGVRLGDIFGIYRDKEGKEKIASLKITAVDLESASGEIEEQTHDIDAGYLVVLGGAPNALETIGGARAVEPLTTAGKDTNSPTEQSAANKLAQVGTPTEAEKVGGTVPKELFTESRETEHERTKDWDAWLTAREKNTRTAYEKVIKKYPGSDGANEAQRCLDDPVYAFLITCQQGTEDAFKGFRKNHPSSQLCGIAESFLKFKRFQRQVRNYYELNEIRKFVRRNPENPFGRAALVYVPAVWLKKYEAQVGVQISLGEIVRKGLLGGTSNPEKVRKSLWKRFSEPLIAEGVAVALIDESDTDFSESRFTHLLKIEYTEQQTPYRSSNYYRGSSFQDAAAENLSASISMLLFGSATAKLNATITSTENNAAVFENIQDISVTSPMLISKAFKAVESSSEERLAVLVFSLHQRSFKKHEEEARRIVTEYLTAAQ